MTEQDLDECVTDVTPGTATLYEGDATWHDGPGWYYVIDDYPDEGSCGAFKTRDEAILWALVGDSVVAS